MLINLWYHLHYLCGKYLSFCGIKVQKDTTKRQVFSTTYLSPTVPPPSPWVKIIWNKKLLPICGTVIGNHTTIYSESEDFDSFHTTNLLQSIILCCVRHSSERQVVQFCKCLLSFTWFDKHGRNESKRIVVVNQTVSKNTTEGNISIILSSTTSTTTKKCYRYLSRC